MGRSSKEDAPCKFTISWILDSGYASDDVVQMGKGIGLSILIVLGCSIRTSGFHNFRPCETDLSTPLTSMEGPIEKPLS